MAENILNRFAGFKAGQNIVQSFAHRPAAIPVSGNALIFADEMPATSASTIMQNESISVGIDIMLTIGAETLLKRR